MFGDQWRIYGGLPIKVESVVKNGVVFMQWDSWILFSREEEMVSRAVRGR